MKNKIETNIIFICNLFLLQNRVSQNVFIRKSLGKADELKQLKSDLAALDRKITAELAPKHDEEDGEEVRRY